MYDYETMDRLHKAGKMPDWAYYQQRGLSPEVALEEQTQAFLSRIRAEYEAREEAEARARAKAKEKKDAQAQDKALKAQAMKAVELAMKDLLKDFNKR